MMKNEVQRQQRRKRQHIYTTSYMGNNMTFAVFPVFAVFYKGIHTTQKTAHTFKYFNMFNTLNKMDEKNNKAIAPINEKTHHRVKLFKVKFKAKNWNEAMEEIMDRADEWEKLKVDSGVAKDQPQDYLSEVKK